MRKLPMQMSAEQALHEWTDLWLRSTDPESTSGDHHELRAYRKRHQQLALEEERAAATPAPEPEPLHAL